MSRPEAQIVSSSATVHAAVTRTWRGQIEADVVDTDIDGRDGNVLDHLPILHSSTAYQPYDYRIQPKTPARAQIQSITSHHAQPVWTFQEV